MVVIKIADVLLVVLAVRWGRGKRQRVGVSAYGAGYLSACFATQEGLFLHTLLCEWTVATLRIVMSYLLKSEPHIACGPLSHRYEVPFCV